MKNLELAKLFYEMADMLEMQGVQWKPRAYRTAARAIESMSAEERAAEHELIAESNRRGDFRHPWQMSRRARYPPHRNSGLKTVFLPSSGV